MASTDLIVTKYSGEQVPFSIEKLKLSLERAGADEKQCSDVLAQIKEKLYPGISTKKIYRLAFNLLKGNSRHLAARYNLKRAIMELGPSGYPFEKFVSNLLLYDGYKTALNITVKGKCVTHETDIIAERDDLYCVVECKYHNQPGHICDVKIPLYVQSRFKDIEEQILKVNATTVKKMQGWIVTNTRFSSDAIQYGVCAGLKLLGWDYPIRNSLKDMIDTLKLYPITCLTTLTKKDKEKLLNNGVILCKDLVTDQKPLLKINLPLSKIKTIQQEAEELCLALAEE